MRQEDKDRISQLHTDILILGNAKNSLFLSSGRYSIALNDYSAYTIEMLTGRYRGTIAFNGSNVLVAEADNIPELNQRILNSVDNLPESIDNLTEIETGNIGGLRFHTYNKGRIGLAGSPYDSIDGNMLVSSGSTTSNFEAGREVARTFVDELTYEEEDGDNDFEEFSLDGDSTDNEESESIPPIADLSLEEYNRIIGRFTAKNNEIRDTSIKSNLNDFNIYSEIGHGSYSFVGIKKDGKTDVVSYLPLRSSVPKKYSVFCINEEEPFISQNTSVLNRYRAFIPLDSMHLGISKFMVTSDGAEISLKMDEPYKPSLEIRMFCDKRTMSDPSGTRVRLNHSYIQIKDSILSLIREYDLSKDKHLLKGSIVTFKKNGKTFTGTVLQPEIEGSAGVVKMLESESGEKLIVNKKDILCIM